MSFFQKTSPLKLRHGRGTVRRVANGRGRFGLLGGSAPLLDTLAVGGGRCRPRGCLASGTSGGGGRLDAPGGTRAGRRGVGAWRDAGREPSRSARAGTDVW